MGGGPLVPRLVLSGGRALLVTAALTVIRLPRAVWNFLFFAFDVVRGRFVMRGGVLHCPAGHEVPTRGVYECNVCSFTYRGSPWVCGNVECRARTPFVDCPECGLSCRNPYRFGRP